MHLAHLATVYSYLSIKHLFFCASYSTWKALMKVTLILTQVAFHSLPWVLSTFCPSIHVAGFTRLTVHFEIRSWLKQMSGYLVVKVREDALVVSEL